MGLGSRRNEFLGFISPDFRSSVMVLAVIAAHAGGLNSHTAVECRSETRRDTLYFHFSVWTFPQPTNLRRRQIYTQFSNSVLLIKGALLLFFPPTKRFPNLLPPFHPLVSIRVLSARIEFPLRSLMLKQI